LERLKDGSIVKYSKYRPTNAADGASNNINMPKQLLPSLRERNRYIAFEVISDSDIGREGVMKAVWGSVLRFLGELNTSRTGLWVMDWNDEKKKGILKVNHKNVDEVKAALTLVKEINGKGVILHILGISGTVKKTRERYLKEK